MPKPAKIIIPAEDHHAVLSLLILVRHGESEANVNYVFTHDLEGFPLTEKGRGEAGNAARIISGLGISRIFCSPVLRTRQTAEYISKETGKKVIIDQLLTETYMGKMNGVALKLKLSDMPVGKREEMQIEAWESHVERAARFMAKLDHDGRERIVAVTHGFIIKSFVGAFLGLPEESIYGVNIATGSITVLDLGNRRIHAIGTYDLRRF